MPLARAPMLFVTVAQEKRDFKIFVILRPERPQVRILSAAPKRSLYSSDLFIFPGSVLVNAPPLVSFSLPKYFYPPVEPEVFITPIRHQTEAGQRLRTARLLI